MPRHHALTICLALATSAALAQGVSPGPAEQAAFAQLEGRITGQIVWESNRTGHWELYTMNADGTGAHRLTDSPGDSTDACLSDDGKRILFTRALPGQPTAAWVMNHDGRGAEKLIDDADDPLWRKGGTAIHFLRRPDPRQKHWQTWEYDPGTRRERLLFPPPGVEFRADIWSAVGNDDGTRFVAWSRRPRGTWVMSPDGQVQEHVHPGCDGRIGPVQRHGYGVETAGRFVRFNLGDGGGLLPFNERHGDWSHTYFPWVSSDGNWLIYGACPPDQHDQNTSDYEIFIVRLKDWATVGDPVRLTFNTRTDRWPTIFVAPTGRPNPLLAGPYDVAGNPRTNPPPPPLPIFTFRDQDAGPDFGGAWGLWPQQGDCRGTTAFVPGDDAAKRGGGSMRVEYQIGGEPNSVALWITPPGNAINLSAYDRLAIYAKGDVPSFTLVVKDRHSEEQETPKGVADFVVNGITPNWRRFLLPLDQFRPRERGAKIDWSGIKLMAVALIHPQNAASGALQVDNLQALPAGAD